MFEQRIVDAWPDLGADARPPRRDSSPLLPPLPALSRDEATHGWVLEWPVSWLRNTPLPRFSLRPASPSERLPAQGSARITRPSLGGNVTGPLGGRVTRPLGGNPTRPLGGNVTRPLGGSVTRPQLATRPELEARLAQLSSSRPLNRPAPRSYPTRLPARARRRRRGSFAIVTILLLLMATGVGILLADNGVLDLGGLGLPLDTLRPFTSGGESSPASSTATILPVIDAPVLGSEASAFTALFGASEPTAVAEGGPQFQARIAGQSVGLRVQFGIGADRRERVVMIGASDPTLAGWDAATADAICATFLPRDAHLRKFSHVSGQTEYVYTSASLAALFSPAYFVDDSQQAVTPGIFNRLDQPALDPTRGVGACTLGLGQHYGS